jgi:hypothetical protein
LRDTLLLLNIYPFLSGKWFGVVPIKDTRKICVLKGYQKEIGMRAENLMTSLSVVVNIIGGGCYMTI